jgi:predicted unusual protein kinase regulating ubiquinone biosynthesis (AarF/ABC1/UbiB family)
VPSDRIPKSRLARTARVSSLAAGQAARHLGTRATNLARGEQGRARALERRQLEAAEQIVAALGTMKGAAMKLGQVLSFLDVGLVPEEHREEFQRKLGELRDAAPKVRFSDMRKVIESELGEKLSDVFEEFDEQPIAAASIGQVYRACLEDGREVAVKVQYPGVAQAVRADMQNLGMILRLMKRVAPGLDVKATGEEIRARIGEELDYELEAQNQRTLARIFRGHPFIVIPEVISSLSREKVMVSEYVEGIGFETLKEADQATRDRLGEIVFRFYFGCMYRHGSFSGDPHPGNFLLLGDGLPAASGEVPARQAAGPVPGCDLVVRARRGRDPAAARGRDPGDDRHVRPALVALRPAAPRDAARRPHLRAPGGDAHAGRARPAAGHRELAPDRARMDVRRRAGDRAGPPRGRVLRLVGPRR